MAKSRSTAPGSHTQRGVRCTMDAPFGKNVSTAASGGMNGKNKAPFDAPQDMGNGGIPTRFFDGMPTTAAASANAGQAGPIMQGTQKVGQRRFKR